MTANAIASVSLDPPLVLVVVDHRARLHRFLEAAGQFGVSVLSEEQEPAGWHFAGRPQPGPLPPFSTLNGVPVLDGAIAHLACDVSSAYLGGDHTIFVGRVTALRAAEGEPLLFYRGRFHRGIHGPFMRRAEDPDDAAERPALEAWR